MKILKNASLTILLVIVVYSANGQYNRLKGATSTQIAVGVSDVGFVASIYYLKSFDQKVKAGIGAGGTMGKISDINYKSIFIDGIGSYSIYNGNRAFYLNALGGVSLVGDFKNDFPSETYNKKFNFNYGVFGGLESEFVVSRQLSFIISGTQRYYIKKAFGQWRYQITAGLRISL